MGAAEELEALWNDVFGGPPPVKSDAATLAAVLVGSLPRAPAYAPNPSWPNQVPKHQAPGRDWPDVALPSSTIAAPNGPAARSTDVPSS